jgi:hypothetical protein
MTEILIYGFAGGAMSAGLLPGPLAVIARWWLRLPIGGACGAIIASGAAAPLALWLGRPEYSLGVALGVGFVGLAFLFKLLATWNELDLGSYARAVLDALIGRFKK